MEESYYTTPLDEPKKLTKNFLDIFEPIIYALIAVVFITLFIARLTVVDGRSMETKLQNGNYIVVSDLFLTYKPKQGDIVVAHGDFEGDQFDKPIVKRVIATGGQTVKIQFFESNYVGALIYVKETYLESGEKNEKEDWVLFETASAIYDGELSTYEYNYLGYPASKYVKTNQNYDYVNKTLTVEVPEGHVFLMGDNRYHSADSRMAEIGCVPEKYILGKAILRLTPFSEFGSLYKD